MSNKNSLLITLLLGLVFCSVSAFASNLTERNVYGILSENFTGATMYNSKSQDNIGIWAGSISGEWISVAAVHISSYPANAKEGNKYWEIVLDKWNNSSGYWASVVFPFITASSTPPDDSGFHQTEKATDISHFRYLDFWVQPKTGDITKVLVGVHDSNDKCVTFGSLGITNSNTWQHVVLDLNTLGANLSSIKKPFVLSANSQLTQNTCFYVDNVVLRTDDSSADFNITLKNVETMQSIPSNPNGNIMWKQTVFQKGWQAACQYVELDMDMCCFSWTVRVYTNNGGANRGGLYASLGSKDYVIPMCWRAYNGELKNEAGKDSYIIKQSTQSHHNLYDYGRYYDGDPNYYTWFYMKDQADVDFNNPSDVDYITVWNSSLGGYHGEVNAVGQGYYEFMKDTGRVDEHGNPIYVPTVEKKPRIYFGGGFDSAAGGITYVGNVVFELNYE